MGGGKGKAGYGEGVQGRWGMGRGKGGVWVGTLGREEDKRKAGYGDGKAGYGRGEVRVKDGEGVRGRQGIVRLGERMV